MSRGKDLIYSIKKVAFEYLELNQIVAEVLSKNINAIEFYKKHGFIYLSSEKKYNKFYNGYDDIEIFVFNKEFL